MKKITYILFLVLFISTYTYAQGELDALRFSRSTDLHGTARAVSMGGAFGALGGDQTGVSINPAGIAVYRSSEVVGTIDFTRDHSKVGNFKAHANTFDLSNLSFVGYFPMRSDAMPLINFGFSYNRLKSFDKEVLGVGSPKNSLMDYIADRSEGIHPDNLQMGDNLPDPFISQPWLSVLGYNSYLINPHQDAQGYFYTPLDIGGEPIINEVWSRERGYIDNYDFTIGTTINNILNLGLSISVSDIYYSLSSEYLEKFNSGGYTLVNSLKTSGAGVGAKFGAIYRPSNELRIGVAYHTPTWYSLTETYWAEMQDNLADYISDPDYESGRTYSATFRNDYDLKTPGKWVLSVASVLGNRFIASLDYELTNYQNMELRVPGGSNQSSDWYDIDNDYISTDFRSASTVKAGIEYRFTQQFSGRLGYAWMQNPYKTDFRENGNAAIAGSTTIYRMEGDTNFFTAGIGYRFNRNFFMDLAVVYKTQTDDLYPFPSLYDTSDRLVIDGSPFTLKNNSYRGLLTFGYKF